MDLIGRKLFGRSSNRKIFAFCKKKQALAENISNRREKLVLRGKFVYLAVNLGAHRKLLNSRSKISGHYRHLRYRCQAAFRKAHRKNFDHLNFKIDISSLYLTIIELTDGRKFSREVLYHSLLISTLYSILGKFLSVFFPER